MKNKDERTKINNTVPTRKDRENGAFDDELFLSDIFKAEDERKARRADDTVTHVGENRARTNEKSSDGDFLSPDEIDAFFEEIKKRPAHDDMTVVRSDELSIPSFSDEIAPESTLLPIEDLVITSESDESNIAPEPIAAFVTTDEPVMPDSSDALRELARDDAQGEVPRAKRRKRSREAKARRGEAVRESAPAEAAVELSASEASAASGSSSTAASAAETAAQMASGAVAGAAINAATNAVSAASDAVHVAKNVAELAAESAKTSGSVAELTEAASSVADPAQSETHVPERGAEQGRADKGKKGKSKRDAKAEKRVAADKAESADETKEAANETREAVKGTVEPESGVKESADGMIAAANGTKERDSGTIGAVSGIKEPPSGTMPKREDKKPKRAKDAARKIKKKVEVIAEASGIYVPQDAESHRDGARAADDRESATAQTQTRERTSFEKDVDALTYEQTGSTFPREAKKTNFFRLATLVVCACVFVYCIQFIANNLYEKYKSDSVYNEINSGLEFNIPGSVVEGGIVSLLKPDSVGVQTPTMEDIIKNGVSDSIVTGAHSAELAKVRASLEHLKNINDDLYGYIMIPGTNISYPIAQHESDNNYYLDRAYNGEHLVNGSIFADVRCNEDVMMNYNTVLFGHNVTSGSMFNHVSMFFDRDFFENTLIYIYTYDGIFVYKPFSIHEAEYDSGYIRTAFPTVEDFVNFASELRDLSDIKSDVEFKAESRIITLSTCTNGIHTRRYALHAYLVERITD